MFQKLPIKIFVFYHNTKLGDALKKMVKEQKSESYLVDNTNKLLNKFELHFLLKSNKKLLLK